jgi:TusA-related sulfurtransferase
MAQISTLDLEANRCPAAMIMTRRAIEAFDKDSTLGSKLYIQTIEPSFSRDLVAFINSEFPSIRILDKVSCTISDESKVMWQDKFDVEDWKGTEQSCYILIKQPEVVEGRY